jgi:hypothetical protein
VVVQVTRTVTVVPYQGEDQQSDGDPEDNHQQQAKETNSVTTVTTEETSVLTKHWHTNSSRA